VGVTSDGGGIHCAPELRPKLTFAEPKQDGESYVYDAPDLDSKSSDDAMAAAKVSLTVEPEPAKAEVLK